MFKPGDKIPPLDQMPEEAQTIVKLINQSAEILMRVFVEHPKDKLQDQKLSIILQDGEKGGMYEVSVRELTKEEFEDIAKNRSMVEVKSGDEIQDHVFKMKQNGQL